MEFFPDEGTFKRRFTLGPKGQKNSFKELMVALKARQTVDYVWRAEAEVDFNIHSHEGQQVTYHRRSRGRQEQSGFEGPADGHFYLMWQNPSSQDIEVEVEVALRG